MKAIHISEQYYLVPLQPTGYAIGVRIGRPKQEFQYLAYFFGIEDAMRGFLRIVERNKVEEISEAERNEIENLVECLSDSWKAAVNSISEAVRESMRE